MSNLVGKRANIKPKRDFQEWNEEYKHAWGTIVHFDGDQYHIQMFCDSPHPTAETLIFDRDEFIIPRNQN